MAFDGSDEPSKPEDHKCLFTEGDVVHLKSGGPRLVVSSVVDDFVLEVHWFDGGVLRSEVLPDWCFIKCDHPA